MAELTTDCPRCGAGHTTFDVTYTHNLGMVAGFSRVEVPSICRACNRTTVFLLSPKQPHMNDWLVNQVGRQDQNVSEFINVLGYVSIKDARAAEAPTDLPDEIGAAWREGATCLAVKCPNAAAAMFRLCLDHATKGLLPEEDLDGLNNKIRRSLGLRLDWLFNTNRLPEAFRELSTAVKDDGNDGAHDGTLTQEEGEDLMDFAYALLDRLYSEPARLKASKLRREARHNSS